MEKIDIKAVVRDMRGVRGRVQEASQRVAEIRNDGMLSAEGKGVKVQEEIGQIKKDVDSTLKENVEFVGIKKAKYNKKLQELLHVTDEAKAARSATLQPILQGIGDNPKGFASSYVKRFNDVPARKVLEETAQSYLDIATTPQKNAFTSAWQQAVSEAEGLKSVEEKELEGRIDQAQKVGGYVQQNAFVLQNGLDHLEGKQGRGAAGTKKTFAEHAIRQYEKAADQDE